MGGASNAGGACPGGAPTADGPLDRAAAGMLLCSYTSKKEGAAMDAPICAEDCIFFHLAKADQVATRFWARRIGALGVTPVQGLVLNFLHDNDRIRSVDLGRRVMLDSATLTGVLDRLESLDFIARDKHPEDRRAVLVSLTPAGRRLAARLYKSMQEANEAFLAEHLSEEEAMILKMLLKKVRQAG